MTKGLLNILKLAAQVLIVVISAGTGRKKKS